MDRVYFISANDTCEAVFSTDGSVEGSTSIGLGESNSDIFQDAVK